MEESVAQPSDRPLRVGLVDDHLLFRKGVAAILRHAPGLTLVLEADDGQQLVDQLAAPDSPAVDVLLLDMEMPRLDGVATTRWLRRHRPEIRIIILSMHGDDSLITNLIEEGVSGYLLKNAHPEEVILAIRQVWTHGHYFNERVTRVMQRQLQLRGVVRQIPLSNGHDPLTDVEQQVLVLVVRGLSNAEIAEKLFVSPRTVEGRRHRMQQKLGVRSLNELMRYAAEHNLL